MRPHTQQDFVQLAVPHTLSVVLRLSFVAYKWWKSTPFVKNLWFNQFSPMFHFLWYAWLYTRFKLECDTWGLYHGWAYYILLGCITYSVQMNNNTWLCIYSNESVLQNEWSTISVLTVEVVEPGNYLSCQRLVSEPHKWSVHYCIYMSKCNVKYRCSFPLFLTMECTTYVLCKGLLLWVLFNELERQEFWK